MAAGLGFKTFNTGDVLSAADVNGYLMQGVLVFADTTARDAAITSPQEGQFAFTKNNDSLWYYSGSAWVASGATGDIEGVTAGVGISGGGTSGTVTITNSMATAIDAKGDLIGGTGADTFARLAVGANGTVLTADSAETTGLKWAAAASGGGMTSIASGSLSGSSLVLSSISGSYNDLFLVLRNATFSSNAEVQVRINNNTGTVYDQLGLNVTTSTFAGYGSQNGTISGVTYYGTSSQGSYVLSSRFIDYAKTTTRKQIQHHASYTRHDNAGQETTVKFDTVRDANAIDRIDVLLTNSATFNGGTYILYGVK